MQENENQPITNSSEAKALRKKQQQPQCLRLQDRDYLALKLICDLGYLTADQIALYIFRSTNKNTRRRLYMLEKAGYIQGIYRRDKVANRKIYIPKFKNLDGVVDEKTHLRCVSTMNSRPWFRPHFEHEDKIRSWAIRIQNSFKNCTADLDFMRYWYRPTLKKVDFNDTTLIPDLTIYVDEEFLINIEIELCAKSNFRYYQKIKDILEDWRASTIYLVGDQTIANKILNVLAQVQNGQALRSEKAKSKVLVFLESEIKGDQDLLLAIDQARGQ